MRAGPTQVSSLDPSDSTKENWASLSTPTPQHHISCFTLSSSTLGSLSLLKQSATSMSVCHLTWIPSGQVTYACNPSNSTFCVRSSKQQLLQLMLEVPRMCPLAGETRQWRGSRDCWMLCHSRLWASYLGSLCGNSPSCPTSMCMYINHTHYILKN